MKKQCVWAAITLLMAMGATGCSLSDDKEDDGPKLAVCPIGNERVDIKLTPEEAQLVIHNNDFAFNLFRASVETVKSQVLSPLSITSAPGLLHHGAAGDTQKQINEVLGGSASGVNDINTFCHKLLTQSPQLDELTKVMIANTIFVNKDYQLKDDFVNTAKQFYDATPETRDFHDGKTLDVINQWASDHTEKMIEKILNEQSFKPDAVSYLLNAIYFKGMWSKMFNADETKDEAFEGSNKPVPMMHQNEEFGYTENELCQALCLPYGNHAYQMTVLLPREGKNINDILQGLTTQEWKYYQYMSTAMVDVKLPRFESNTDISLNDIMARLGMPKAFTENAEFPDFCNKPTYIGLMKQCARIKLNEQGTEAAAVTAIGMVNTSVPAAPRHVTFHANRPFLYVISEYSTGAIFFIGQYYGD